MKKEQLKDYLAIDSIEGLIKENKLLTCLYTVFTILFIDVQFFVTSLFKINPILVFSTMIVMTILIIPLVIVNFIGKKTSLFQLFIVQGIILALIATIWFGILFVKSQCNDIIFTKWHIITAFIMMLIILSAVMFRVYKLCNYYPKKKKKRKVSFYGGIFTIGMGITIVLRQFFRNLGTEMTHLILSYGLIVLGAIFLMISIIAFFNAFVVKKYRFMLNK